MNHIDKSKLKVLIKMVLIMKSPQKLNSNQIYEIINKSNWGFSSDISPMKIGSLLSYELKRRENHFMDDIKTIKGSDKLLYYYI